MPKKLNRNVLPEFSFKLLQELSKKKELKDFYLVGGTALSLILGHRMSVDLDFFSSQEFSYSLIDRIGKPFEPISIHNNSIECFIDKTKVFFFYFAFPRYKELLSIESIRMANPLDIGLMKLLALQGRCTKKDIIDLYFIDSQIISLEKLLEIFNDFYPKERINTYESIKTLLVPKILNSQPDPIILKKKEYVSWEHCFLYVSRKIVKAVKKELI